MKKMGIMEHYNSDDSLSHIYRDITNQNKWGNTHSTPSLEELRFEKPLN